MDGNAPSCVGVVSRVGHRASGYIEVNFLQCNIAVESIPYGFTALPSPPRHTAADILGRAIVTPALPFYLA